MIGCSGVLGGLWGKGRHNDGCSLTTYTSFLKACDVKESARK